MGTPSSTLQRPSRSLRSCPLFHLDLWTLRVWIHDHGQWDLELRVGRKPLSPVPRKPPKPTTTTLELWSRRKDPRRRNVFPRTTIPTLILILRDGFRRERTGLKYMPGGYRRPRKDKRKAEKFTGAQGTDQGKSDNYDYSNRVAETKGAAAKQTSPAPEPAPGPRLQKGPARANNKKKKSGKNKF